MPQVIPEEYVPIPTADYRVRLKTLAITDGQWGQQWQWDLEVSLGAEEGHTLRAWSSTSASLKAKFAKWATAFGAELEIGVPFETDTIIGQEAIATVLDKPKTDGTPGNEVAEIKAIPRKAKGLSPPPMANDPFTAAEPPSTPAEQASVHVAANKMGLTKEGYANFLSPRGFKGTSELSALGCESMIEIIEGLTFLEVQTFNGVITDPFGKRVEP